MELLPEWQIRTEHWIRTLAADILTDRVRFDSEAFFTFDHLTYDEAMKREFSPIKQGEKWGKTWEYMWVRTTAVVDERFDGRDIVTDLAVGGEASVWLNGEEFGCRRNEWVRDRIHMVSDLELTKCAKKGDRFEIVCEVYAGHGFPDTHHGPMLGTGRPKNDESSPEGGRAVFDGIYLGSWDEDAYQLYLDATMLSRSLKVIPEDTLRYDDIRAALKQFTVIVDFENEKSERTKLYKEAREALRPAMEAVNGTVTPVMYAFGHAHIDVAWLWPLQETERKVMRTFAAQLRHMDRYPDYKFIQSQPQLYRYVKQYYPGMFERIKEKVRAGQWIPEGGMWVEADTNIASGEALVRQFIHGKRFIKDELGYDSRMLWLPDVFGYNAALPEIMKGCGIDYFCTQKLTWAYNGGEPFPLNYFNWVGLDGTRIPTFVHGNYTADTDPETVSNLWKKRRQRKGLRGFIMPYGYGDGGGGPSRDFIENLARAKDFQGVPRCENRHPNDYFIDNPDPEESYVGELYLQVHRGTLTSQAKTKKNNRKSELSLRETEFLGQIAKLSGCEYPLENVDELWKTVLLLQFHDILPGSSINRVYREAEASHAQVLSSLKAIREDFAKHLFEGGGITAVNSLSFPRRAMIKLPDDFDGAAAEDGALPVQKIGNGKYALATLPPCGTLSLVSGEYVCAQTGVTASLTESGAVMENGLIRVVFNEFGAITSIYDKAACRELAKGLNNDFKMYRDDPARYDAWDVDSTYEYCPVELFDKAKISVLATDGFVAKLSIERKINNSFLRQTAVLFENEKRVDFETEIDWNETHKLLKVCFDTAMVTDQAYNEIQFGYIKRPNHRSRQYDFDRFEVCNHRYTALVESGRGFAVINDCKYGVNQLGGSINLTLLRSPTAPDAVCDTGKQTFTYGFVTYEGPFANADVIRAACDLNSPFEVYSGSFGDGSLITVDAKNVLIESLKPCEDGGDDYIIRLYEAAGSGVNALLSLGIPCKKAYVCNMLEEIVCEAEAVAGEDGITDIPLGFGAFEIKTLRITP